MSQTLHILNGDATRPQFERSAIAGNIMIWREMLVEGPALYPVLTEDWFETRRDFINQAYKPEDHDQVNSMRNEFEKLLDLSGFDEIVLWFEYDLFCQVNMIAALSTLGKFNGKVSLVCPEDHPEIENFRGLGQLSARHFGPLFAERLSLSAEDLAFANRVYQAYAAANPQSLLKMLNQDFPEAFPSLKAALQLHLQRFPNKQNGLALEEQEMLQLLGEGLPSRFKWVGSILRGDHQRGFGDSQYFHRIDRLEPLFVETEESVRLSEKGEKVLAGEAKFEAPSVWIGGASSSEWTWDEGRLVKA
ncbi:MAG: hypothetical protein AAF927_10715 [Bacteroidota bacterium]